MSAWINSLPSAPIVLIAYQDDVCVGLAFFTQRIERIFLGIKIKQLWLHRCGEQGLDQMWIEHNDFLLHSSHKQSIREAMTTYLLEHQHLWQELHIGLSRVKTLGEFQHVLPYSRIDLSSPDFEVNLRDKMHVDDYLKDLSKNTRAQIRRTEKILSQGGSLSLTIANTDELKRSYLQDIAALHKDKWQDTEYGSGFDNPIFEHFHQQLIFDAETSNVTSLYCLRVNDEPLAYIYILKEGNAWYFYLSAIKNHTDNRIKIGLLAHTYIIKEAIEQQVTKYSFLAGEARYKQSLSNTPSTMQKMACFYQPSLLMRSRETLRHFKHALQKSFKD
ncbi:GNAT family N-acetyltransferase [Paraglaciecola sp. 20A4]|uniref:GNAT family N-acetyltransferase n=1 Tax=Paraglaciecola sp. 20A4 TaxID=2687288 RepID=UPI00198257E7|nr:GNAT family N-acetyltransferase [Paraglaciecola sp. 20A4]